MLEVKKNKDESTTNLLRRFKNKIRQSNVLSLAKSKRFKQRSVSKASKKKNALKKVEKTKKFEELKLLGKI